MHVVPHRPSRTSVVLWIQAEASERGWSLVLRGADGTTRTWAPEGEPPTLLPNVTALLPATRTWMPEFGDLAPGTDHTAFFVTRDVETRAATFRTLPADLDRPFTVLLASCYSEQDDLPPSRFWDLFTRHDVGLVAGVAQRLLRSGRKTLVTLRSATRFGLPEVEPRGTVSRCYRDLVEAEGEPDLKILCGDQVYVDDPIWHFWIPRGRAWIAKHLSDTYSRTWDRLGWFLSRGGNVFTSDDHEFWNNYPARRLTAWFALRFAWFARAWDACARQFLERVQAPQPTWGFDLAEVSFLVADTRMHREAPETGRFMRDADFAALTTWIAGLDRPGVLVVSQPLLASPGGEVTDYGLPAYTAQYTALCDALVRCPHDVLVLTGDIHYGRLAQAEIPAADGVPAHRYVELVSSPTAALLHHPGTFDATADAPGHFPPEDSVPAAASRGPVAYSEIAPRIDGENCADHFVLLSFARGDEPGTVSVGVRVVLPDGRPEGQPAVEPPGPIVLRSPAGHSTRTARSPT